jgi:hypothetical protein
MARASLLIFLTVPPGVLALMAKSHDQKSMTDSTLPVGIYYLVFLLLISGAASIVWTSALAIRWIGSKLKGLKGTSNG